LLLNRSFYAGDSEALIEGSTFIAIEFVRFGLTVHLVAKEPDRVTSKTESPHAHPGSDRTTTADLSATEDYDVVGVVRKCRCIDWRGAQSTISGITLTYNLD
jgi:hypothetical protein